MFEPRTGNWLPVLSVFAALSGRPDNHRTVRNVTPRMLDAMHIPVHFTTAISIEDVSLSVRQNRYKKSYLDKYT